MRIASSALAIAGSIDSASGILTETTVVFREPYASTVPGLFDMRQFWDDILAGLPPIWRQALVAPPRARKTARVGPDWPRGGTGLA